MSRIYKSRDGTEYPLIEAAYNMTVKVFRADRKKSIMGDPYACLVAFGINRHPDVVESFIGSGGDAYVIFKPTDDYPNGYAVHFTIPTTAARVRDQFDKEKAAKSITVWLRKPTKARTLNGRSLSNKKRRIAVKEGAPVKKRGKSNVSRVVRLGVAHRPRAKISRGLVAAI